MTVLPSIVAAPCGQLTLATIVLLAGTTATASSAPTAAAAAAAPAKLLSPADGATIYCARSGATPRFTWDAGPVPSAVAALPDTVIEISASPTFSGAVFLARDNVPAILSRYVRARAANWGGRGPARPPCAPLAAPSA
jgi:hypothetical protein